MPMSLGSHVRRHCVGYVALLVALGGTSYAASTLPPDSVGTRQLKNGAVTTSKLHSQAVTGAQVKPGSLVAGDFKPGQLPGNAYLRAASPKAIPTTGRAVLATLRGLPAGRYAIDAQISLNNAGTEADVFCTVEPGTTVKLHTVAGVTLPRHGVGSTFATVPIVDALTLKSTSNSVSVGCTSNGGRAQGEASLRAVQVPSLHEQRDKASIG
jgi:hypothetical protein